MVKKCSNIRNKKKRLLTFFYLVIISLIFVIYIPLKTQASSPNEFPEQLPPLAIHPLPERLKNWQDVTESGDYFPQIKPPQFGQLIWSNFPIKVFIESPKNTNLSEEWVRLVSSGVQEWEAYLPLEIVAKEEDADIKIYRQNPPLKPGERARSAETRYEIYIHQEGTQETLSHRFTIYLSPTHVGKYVASASRHELGHALGIWGHSPVETDVMYFSQIRNPISISPRDINTLKRVYQQPTRLGWTINNKL
ncbi:MAG: peptidase [Microcoleaceae cyanobacterium]